MERKTYDWRRIAAEVAAIQSQRQGLVAPADVVAWAADNPESEAAKFFTWDDSEAAAKCRLEEAGELLRAVRYRFVGSDVPDVMRPRIRNLDSDDRAYVSLPSDRSAGGGYRDAEAVLVDEGRRREWLLAFAGELDAMERRGRKFHELRPLWDLWRSIREAIDNPPAKKRPKQQTQRTQPSARV